MVHRGARLWRAAGLVAACAACGSDAWMGNHGRPAAGVAIAAQFLPGVARQTSASFSRVSAVFRRMSGAVALDTTVTIGDNTAATAINFTIPFSTNTPVSGELLTVELSCLTTAGDTVYRGGPAIVLLSPWRVSPPVTVVLEPVGSILPVNPAVGLVLSTVGSVVEAGVPLASPIVVQAVDAAGRLVSSFTGAVTLALGASPSGAALVGTTSVNAVGGVATFSGVTLMRAAAGYTLLASATGLASTSSGPISVTPAAPAVTSVASGGGQTGIVGALLGAPLRALVVDRFGNPVPGTTVNWAVTLGGGILGSPTSVTDASGIASNVLRLGVLPGVNQVSATVGNLAPAIFTLTGIVGQGE